MSTYLTTSEVNLKSPGPLGVCQVSSLKATILPFVIDEHLEH